MRALSAQSLIFYVVIAACLIVGGYMIFSAARIGSTEDANEGVSKLTLDDIPADEFDGRAAYDDLKKICAIGPRPSGSPNIAVQQKLMVDHFTKLGGQVSKQEFNARNPQDGSPIPMVNIIVAWHPERKERILLCTHYDTRPFPDRDKRNPKGVFVGANDGGSGVAVLMELAKAMPKLDSKYGVDFVLFDGEEFVFRERSITGAGDPYFLGAEYFARDYAGSKPDFKYRWGVLLDMVGDTDLKIYHESNSVTWPDTRPLVDDIWRTAGRLGVKEFIPRRKYSVYDDHLRLHDIGKIPTCDIIDFDYPYWHTEGDTAEHCSPLALAKVGWVVLEWLKQVK